MEENTSIVKANHPGLDEYFSSDVILSNRK
jgi:hypothetical protein